MKERKKKENTHNTRAVCPREVYFKDYIII